MPDLNEIQRRLTNSLVPQFTMPNLSKLDFTNPNWTSEIFNNLMKWIQAFDAKLDQDHEVGARLVSFGQVVQFYLEEIEYCDSPLMMFKGTTEDGLPVELIQHVSQISVLLMKLPKQNPDAPKRRIGFHTEGTEADEPAEGGQAG